MKKQIVISLLMGLSCLSGVVAGDKIVIAHRGASGYLPEHTLASKAMAHEMNVDYIEQDVVMTKDNHLVVMHDHYLDRVTDVAKHFPKRAREDGRFYVIDFTLDEIRSLQATELFEVKEGQAVAVFPERFPLWKSNFRINTLQEEIELIQGMNRTRNKDVGIYVETKVPWFHKKHGKDITKAVLAVLKEYGYTQKTDKAYLQSFDAPDLIRVKNELLPEMGMDIKLVQLITQNANKETMVIEKDGSLTDYNFDWMHETGAAKQLAQYVDGVGPALSMVIAPTSTPDNIELTTLTKEAHAAGLVLHPYTLRRDAGRIPTYARDFEHLMSIFYVDADVEGVFTDFPDLAVAFLHQQRAAMKNKHEK